MDAILYNQYRSLIHDYSGISLSQAKQSLLSVKIAKRIQELNLDDEEAYLEFLIRGSDVEELDTLVGFVTTHVTSFFRESEHFDFLHRHLSLKSSQGQKIFKIWSSACSSGEEAYSLAMTARESLAGSGSMLKILATDFSRNILSQAKQGLYSEEDLQGVPKNYRLRYFRKSGEFYHLPESLKKMILFRKLNLKNMPYPFQGQFDVIFCRNVMIYFDQKLKSQIVQAMQNLLVPGGIFIISHTETLSGIHHNLQTLQPSLYQKIG